MPILAGAAGDAMTNQVASAHPGWRSAVDLAAGHVPELRPGMSSSGRAVAADSVRRGRARTLQLALAFLWLLDAILQFQAFMFGRGFAGMLQQTATGNPAVIADPISWSARLIAEHGVAANAAFAGIQLAIGLGIAWRPTLRFALGLSIVWSVAVWWLGEGLGGLLSGTASPVSGAPGAGLLYALLAVLLWPRQRDQGAAFVAAAAVGRRLARLTWLVVWAGLA